MIQSIARWWKGRAAPSAAASTAVSTTASDAAGGRVPTARAPRLPPIPDDLLRAARKATLENLRARPRPADQALALETRLWLLRLPEALQPKALARAHPRVANRLALAWPDAQALEPIFDDLLQDRRGDRQGFSRPVATELRRLRHFVLRQQQRLEARERARESERGDTLPLGLDESPGDIDWTPTETIVVRGER